MLNTPFPVATRRLSNIISCRRILRLAVGYTPYTYGVHTGGPSISRDRVGKSWRGHWIMRKKVPWLPWGEPLTYHTSVFPIRAFVKLSCCHHSFVLWPVPDMIGINNRSLVTNYCIYLSDMPYIISFFLASIVVIYPLCEVAIIPCRSTSMIW